MPEATTLDELALTPVSVPDTVAGVSADEGADFRAAIDVRNRVNVALLGADALEVTPEQSYPHWLTEDEEVHGWLMRSHGTVVGRAMMWVPLEDGSQRVQLRVEVLPEHRGRGIGRRALAFLEARAGERGRTILQAWTEHPSSTSAGVTARTGFGAVPDDQATRLAVSAGYALEQVYRVSTLDLTKPLDRVAPLRDEAERASEGYRYVSWMAPTPDDWVDDYAWMKSRMSTDAPAGDSVMDEETWDAARVRRLEKVWSDSGMAVLVGAAEHIASGRLVAFTELVSFRKPGKPIDQNDTLVLAEHRGHRLGALVKTHTLALGREAFPEGDRIVTGNAEENRPMLAVNEAMGFTPTRYSGEWQKVIA
ncbi:GNAT family N-acetyltransferase [Microbacterium aoyamense]|uniref:GNAT family N-acetyltransferase n=1 Tax=Microbacterium aoyamense TaxID=344166 RepID=A0ABN2P8C3_9MICO|nr:GNAT family N-acetyltransferase [Microbacterium aoyamense]